MTFGLPRHHHRVCDSTNTRARELAAVGAPSGTIVTADEQESGRGRQGRAWSAPAGKALLYSAVLRPLDERHVLMPLAVPLAVCDAIESVSSHACTVKWPNDVWIDERKVAGILIEARPQDGWAVIGAGVNIAIEDDQFPPELQGVAISIGSGVSVAETLTAINEALEHWVDAPQTEVLEAFRARDALFGLEVGWGDGSGVADGIDDRGNLVVVQHDGERRSLGAGEVHLSRAAR